MRILMRRLIFLSIILLILVNISDAANLKYDDFEDGEKTTPVLIVDTQGTTAVGGSCLYGNYCLTTSSHPQPIFKTMNLHNGTLDQDFIAAFDVEVKNNNEIYFGIEDDTQNQSILKNVICYDCIASNTISYYDGTSWSNLGGYGIGRQHIEFYINDSANRVTRVNINGTDYNVLSETFTAYYGLQWNTNQNISLDNLQNNDTKIPVAPSLSIAVVNFTTEQREAEIDVIKNVTGNFSYTEWYLDGSLVLNNSLNTTTYTGLTNNTLYNLTFITHANYSVFVSNSTIVRTAQTTQASVNYDEQQLLYIQKIYFSVGMIWIVLLYIGFMYIGYDMIKTGNRITGWSLWLLSFIFDFLFAAMLYIFLEEYLSNMWTGQLVWVFLLGLFGWIMIKFISLFTLQYKSFVR